jgi:1,4-dihydroxy-2-naphthoate octaprenyltransferase
MSALAPVDAVTRAEGFDHVIVSFVGDDGYPQSVAGDFTCEPHAATITVGPVDPDSLPAEGIEVCLTVSHIRPQPGVGYDERRYINLWGVAHVDGRILSVTVEQASGWDEADVPFFEYAERSVPVAHDYLEEVGGRPQLSRWWKFFLATRLPFLTATIVPIALGGAVAAYDGVFSWGWWLLALVAGCAVHLGLNIANDIFDDASGADAANTTPTPFSGRSRVIQYGLVSRKAMIGACAAFYAVAVALGFVIAAAKGWDLLWLGAVGIVLSLAYTAPPFKLVHRGWGEPVTAAGFGPVMTLGAYFACSGQWSGPAVYASLPVAILVALILYVNQIPDRAGDAAVGKRTLIVRWTPRQVERAYAASTITAFVLIAAGPALGITPWWTLAALVTAPMARSAYKGIVANYDQPYALMPAMQTNIALHLCTGLLLVAGYVVAALV